MKVRNFDNLAAINFSRKISDDELIIRSVNETVETSKGSSSSRQSTKPSAHRGEKVPATRAKAVTYRTLLQWFITRNYHNFILLIYTCAVLTFWSRVLIPVDQLILRLL
jgi:hypothetical protein